MSKTPKRPRDMNEWTKRMVDIAPGEIEEYLPTAKQTRASKGGAKGGPARAKALPPAQRSEIARTAAEARWKKARRQPPCHHHHLAH
jgi:hypothetical protein